MMVWFAGICTNWSFGDSVGRGRRRLRGGAVMYWPCELVVRLVLFCTSAREDGLYWGASYCCWSQRVGRV